MESFVKIKKNLMLESCLLFFENVFFKKLKYKFYVFFLLKFFTKIQLSLVVFYIALCLILLIKKLFF